MMESNTPYRANDEDDVIDLGRLFHYVIQGVHQYWILGVIITLVLAVVGFIYAKITYVPIYESSASVIVTDSISSEQTTSDLTLAAQMGKTFSYIVSSDMLRNVVANDLGLSYVGSQITATAVSGTNLLTISVRDKDPQMAYDVLNAVLESYPAISDYVLGATKIEVIQEGEVPVRPVNWSSARKMTMLGGIVGIGIFCATMLLYAFTRKTAGNADDIVSASGAEFITSIPRTTVKKRSKKGAARLLVSQKSINQGFVEAFRNLANRVQQDAESAESKQKKVYLVTSAVASEGKTTAAINLAIVLARRGKRVLLVDSDVRGASLTEVFNLEKADNNLQSFFQGKSSWSESMYTYRRMPLFVMPTSKITDSGEVMRLLSLRNVKKLLGYARRDFDFVILDTPPLGILADAANVASLCDGAILVAKQDYAQLSDIVETVDRLTESGTELLGFVLNHASGVAGNYGYGYGRGYGYGNDYGYQSNSYGDDAEKQIIVIR